MTFFVSDSHGLVMVVDGITSFIPMVESNSDYQKYLAWVAEGNTAEPWEVPNGD